MCDAPKSPELRRVMGFTDLLLFVVLTGFGIMLAAKAGEVGPAGVTFWVVGGLVFYLPLAFCVIILASRYPGEGGLYLWSQQAFGDFAGFLTGWAYWACILPFIPGVLYFIAGSAIFAAGENWRDFANEPAYFIAVSLVALALATCLNILGLKVGKWLHNAGALGNWLPALGLVFLSVVAWVQYGTATDVTVASFFPTIGLKEATLWSVLVMGLTGLEAAPILGDEIHNHRTILKPALILGAVLTIVSQVIATLAVVAVLPPDEFQGSLGFMQAFDRASARAGVDGFLPWVALFVVVGHLGAVGAWSATGARLPFVAGVDRFVPPFFARVHPRWGTPYVALLFQAAIISLLVLLGQVGTATKGAFDVFLSMTLIPTFVPFLFLFAAAIKVQRLAPGPGRMRSGFGRAVVVGLGALGLVTTLTAMVLAVIPSPDESDKVLYSVKVIGLAGVLLALGVSIYVIGSRRKRTVEGIETPCRN